MSRGFLGLFGWFTIPRLSVAVTALLATTSGGVAAPAALVDKIIGLSAVRDMEYLDAGQTIRLGPGDTLVLTYLHSCIQETITGGVVTIGIDQSDVQTGKVTRTKLDCSEGRFVLTGDRDAPFAGRVLRGAKPQVLQ
jgi:hypothetical protein